MSDSVEGTVRDLARGGEGVVGTQMGVVFANGVLPGERVRLSGIHKSGGNLRAERADVLDASAQRVEPACPIAARCGGCPLMIATAPLQAKFKRALVRTALEKLPGGEEVELDWVASSQSLAYRARSRVAWSAGPRGLRLGYHVPRSDHVADVRSCAVLHPVLDGALALLRAAVGSRLVGDGEAHLALGGDGKAVVALRSESPQPPEIYRELEAAVVAGKLAGAALRVGGAMAEAVFGDAREVRDGFDGLPLRGPVAGFSQAHDAINRALVERVVAYARPAERQLVELFAGSGNLTIALAPLAKAMIAIESDAAAADACRENLRARNLDTTVRVADAEKYKPPTLPDVVVLDPPRTGAPGSMALIAKTKPRAVVYVSCDPPTLARDLGMLAAAGYRIEAAAALDMFPQTAHVEAVVRVALAP